MIAAIVRGGRSSSFKGALDYVLRNDPERVGETETANLFSAPGKAHAEMETTAGAAKAIQARARMERGERSGASGSRAENNCFHYALSWHPEDEPSTERMFKAAHATLERLGLAEHQAVIVEHTEKLHKHLHVVVSTIHPETGRANGLYRSAYVLNRWAHEHEQANQMIRTFKRAAVFDREHEWKKKPTAKIMSEGERKAAWSKRQRELSVAREKDATIIKARHAARKDELDRRIDQVRRHAAIDKHNVKSRHRQEINAHWRKQAPKPEMHLRPSASFTRPGMTLGGEMGRALKGMIRTTHHSTAVVAERRTMEQNKNLARDTFARARVSQTPLQPPSPEPPARSAIHGQFRDRSENSHENHLRHRGITDRHDGARAIKQWQRQEIENIDLRTRQMIDKLYEERDSQSEQDKRDWVEHKEKYAALSMAARKEFGFPEKARDSNQSEPEIDRFANEITHGNGPVEAEQANERSTADVRSYVDDYIAGRGRDSAEHEQFASNYGPEIEQEFQRRSQEANQSHEHEQAPTPEPDHDVPEHYVDHPDFDREMGD